MLKGMKPEFNFDIWTGPPEKIMFWELFLVIELLKACLKYFFEKIGTI